MGKGHCRTCSLGGESSFSDTYVRWGKVIVGHSLGGKRSLSDTFVRWGKVSVGHV